MNCIVHAQQPIARRTLLAAAAAAALGSACSRRGGVVTYTGATTLLKVMERLGAVFEASRPGVRFAMSGGGSSKGIEDVARGAASLGGVVRELTHAELARVEPVAIATDGIAIVANAAAPIDQVTREALRELYAPDPGRPHPLAKLLTRVGKASTQGTFQAFAAGLQVPENRLGADVIGASNGEIIELVRRRPNAVGYVSWADAREAVRRGMPLRILDLENVAPTLDSIASGRYPLAHRVHVVLAKSGVDWLTVEFMALLRGPRGAAVLREAGLPPLPRASGVGRP